MWDIPYLVPFRIARPDPNEESSRTAFVHITDRATGRNRHLHVADPHLTPSGDFLGGCQRLR